MVQKLPLKAYIAREHCLLPVLMQAPYILSEAPAASSNASGRTRSHGWTERVTWTAYTVTHSLYTATNSSHTKTSCSLVKSRDRLQKTCVGHKYTENALKPPPLKQSRLSRKQAITINVHFHLYLMNGRCDREAACTTL